MTVKPRISTSRLQEEFATTKGVKFSPKKLDWKFVSRLQRLKIPKHLVQSKIQGILTNDIAKIWLECPWC